MAPSIQLTEEPRESTRGLHSQDPNQDPCRTNHGISNAYNFLFHCGGDEAIGVSARPSTKVVHSQYDYLYYANFIQVRSSNPLHYPLHSSLQVYQRY